MPLIDLENVFLDTVTYPEDIDLKHKEDFFILPVR